MPISRKAVHAVGVRDVNAESIRVGIDSLNLHDHLCHFYADEAEAMAVCIPFVRGGLLREEQVICCLTEEGLTRLRAGLKLAGVDAERQTDAGALRLCEPHHAYLRSGRFEPEEMIAYVEQVVTEALAAGRTGVRVIGDMAWALSPEPGCDRVIEYESKVNHLFSRLDLLAICQYDLRAFSAGTLLEAMRVHPMVLYRGQVCRNAYYVPPEEYLAGEAPGRTLQRQLDALLAAEGARHAARRQERQLRREVELALAESEERYRAIFESAGDAIFVHDLEGHFLDVNQAACDRLGYTREQLLAKTPMEIDTPEYAALAPGRMKELLDRGVMLYPTEHVTRGGEVIATELCSRIIDYGGQKVVLSVARNISARQREKGRMHRHMLDVQRMETVGKLAGGVAHHFNNLLTVIIGNSQWARRLASDEPQVADSLDEVIHAARRAADLTGQLLDFARPSRPRVLQVDMHKAIRDVTRLLDHAFRDKVAVETILEAESAVVRGDPSQLQSCVMNLAFNARDAMPGGGVVEIVTRNVTEEDLGLGRCIEVLVRDSGEGMDEETRLRAADPFFTTRDDRSAMGMGLTSAYAWVRGHGGQLLVDSAPGKGTTVRVLLPLA